MPSCAVAICGNRSNVTNFKSCGVTYHIFPKLQKVREKWIEATGRDKDWSPTKHSSICSSHFEEQSFLPGSKRRLLPTAVPTLKLRLVFETPSTNSEIIISTKKTIIKPQQERKPIVERYKVIIEKYKNAMKAQRLKIRKLHNKLGRYRKKVNAMKNILNALKNDNVISEDHLWLLEL